MRSVFLGTPAAAVPSLAALVDVADVEAVITRPDKARGRSGKPAPPAVKSAALEWGLPVAQPATADELHDVLSGLEIDVAVVVAYGRILKPEVLRLTRFGFVNVHFSLLPRWRGAAPVERALLAGDRLTGVSLMRLDEGLDTGPVISVIETPIADDETGGSLTARLSYLGARLLDDCLPAYVAGSLHPADQLDAGATHAPRLTKDEAEVTAGTGVEHAERLIRAFDPRPGAWCLVDGERMKLVRAVLDDQFVGPGRIEAIAGGAGLGLPGGTLRLERVQPAGKRLQSGAEWMNGRRGDPAVLGSAATDT